MAAHCFDGAEPPPELQKAFDFKTWGVDLLSLPAGELNKVNNAMGAYNAINSYLNAKGRTAEWAKDNRRAWEFVAEVIKMRKTEWRPPGRRR